MSSHLCLRLSCIYILLFCYPCFAQDKQNRQIWNIPNQEHEFIGRILELEKIDLLHKRDPLVAIAGLAGLGKTSLAKQYAIEHRKRYKVVFLIDGRRDVETQLLDLAIELSKRDYIHETFSRHEVTRGARSALDWLKTTNDSWLLIYDNVKTYEDIEHSLPKRFSHPNQHILVTTRKSVGWTKALQIPSFSGTESVSFLRNTLSDKYPTKDLTYLADALGHHPRAILQAALHILRVPGMTCGKYVEMFIGHNKKFTKEEKMILSKQEASVELHHSLEVLLDEIYKSSPKSIHFLATLSFMSCSHIEEELLTKSQDMLDHEGQLTYLHLIGPELLIKNGNHYAVHPYVATVVQNYISENEKFKAWDNCLKILVSYIDNNTDALVKMFETKPNYLNHILDATKHYKGTSSLATELEVAAIYYTYYYQRRYDLAWEICQRCKTRIELIKNPCKTIAEGRLYSLYSPLAQFNKLTSDAIKTGLLAEEILERIDDPLAREELVMLLSNNLATIYNYQGDTTNALKCASKSESLLKANSSAKDKLLVLYVKILCAIDDGDFVLARKYIQEQWLTLENQEFSRFVRHVTNLNAAKIEIKAKEFTKAKLLAEQAYIQALDCSGNDETHETVGRAGTMLAACELCLGDIAKAERLIDNAIIGFTNSYGELRNRQQAYSLMIKGDILSKKNDYVGALDQYSKSMNIYVNELTSMKVDDVSDLYLRFVELGIKIDDELLVQDYLAKHIEIFGLKHSRTVEALQKIKEAEATS